MVRVFVGIMIPKELIHDIISIQRNLSTILPNCKFVGPENLHVSLSFLGDVQDSDIQKLAERLDEVCGRYENFDVLIDKISLIPNNNFVRVIALNVSSNELESFRGDLVNLIGGKSHHSHITLCRVKNSFDKNGVMHLITERGISMKFNVDEIALVKSVLGRNGPVYEIIKTSKMKGS